MTMTVNVLSLSPVSPAQFHGADEAKFHLHDVSLNAKVRGQKNPNLKGDTDV